MSQEAEVGTTVNVFYRTGRAGSARLSDGGGPFGFDIAVALLVDDLIRAYDCDAIAETGCFLGDTTFYLARRYPNVPLYSCDVDPQAVAFAERRLAGHLNTTLTCENSPQMLARVVQAHARPLAFLDAHWGDQWPLVAELDMVAAGDGIALIHDFDIGHGRFSYDTYGDLDCGPDILARMAQPPERFYVFNPGARLPVPCLQVGRRAGVAVVCRGPGAVLLEDNPFLIPRKLAVGVTQGRSPIPASSSLLTCAPV